MYKYDERMSYIIYNIKDKGKNKKWQEEHFIEKL
jgi:hypothetical protein